MKLRALLLLLLVLPPITPAQVALTTTPVQPPATDVVLYAEDFEGVDSLEARGWTTITLEGPRPGYRLAGGAATTATTGGAYAQRSDARLVSPVYDLRHVAGAPLPRPTTLAPPIAHEALGAIANVTKDTRANLTNESQPAQVELDPRDPLTTVLDFDTRPAVDAVNDTLLWPPGGNATGDRLDLDDLSPYPDLDRLAAPNGSTTPPPIPTSVGTTRLGVAHAWDLSPGDGVTVEVRSRDQNGSWGAWRVLGPEGGYSGHLPDQTPAFLGANAGVSTFPLDAFAGEEIQIAFHMRSDAPLPPDGSGHIIDAVQIRGNLHAPDLAIEDLGGVISGAAIALGTSWTPTVRVRNWGAAAVEDVEVRVRLVVDGAHAPGSPLDQTVSLAAGERETLRLPNVTFTTAADVRFEAEIVRKLERPDASNANDRMSAMIRAEDRADARLRLSGPRSVSGVGEARVYSIDAVNAGNLAANGTLSLLATPLRASDFTPLSPAVEVASIPLSLPAGAVPIANGAAPDRDATRVELSWTASARGAYLVEARFAGARSPPLHAYVDMAPSPVVAEPFRAPLDATRPFEADSADALLGWAFDSWSLDGSTIVRDPPSPPTPRQMLVARAIDGAPGAELAAVGDATRAGEGIEILDLALPGGIAQGTDAGNASQAFATNVSYARLIFHREPCECEDPAARVPLLAPLLNASVHQEELTIEKHNTTIALKGGRILVGGAEADGLYVVYDGRIDPGVVLVASPIMMERDNGDVAGLPAQPPQLYEDDGLRCCVIGPLSAADLLEAPRVAGVGVPAALRATHAVSRHTISRTLDDLLADIPVTAESVLAFEHRAAFAWANGSGTRGLVEIEPAVAMPPELRTTFDAIELSNATNGWESIAIPLSADARASASRLRLTLERVDNGNLSPLADCPYLDTSARCDVAPSWHIDALRVLVRDTPGAPWRVAHEDTLDDPRALDRWTGAWGPSAPSAYGRGWGLAAAELDAPHHFALSEAGRVRPDEANTSRALRWGDPSTLRVATSAPTWSLARSPPIDIGDLTTPTLTFATRYDLGNETNGTHAAGGAIVALVEDMSGARRRVLLTPQSVDGDEGGAYRAHVSAPEFDNLSRALRIELPRGATASALVGSSNWTTLRIDLAPIAGARRAWIEMHVVSAAPLRALGWIIDDIRIGEPGPAHDLALAGFPGLASAIGRNVPTALAVNVTNVGAYRASETRVEITVVGPNGTISYAATNVTLPQGPLGTVVLAFPAPWIPQHYGLHRVIARLVSPGDEDLANDLIERRVVVRDAVGGALSPASPILASERGLAPDAPADLRLTLTNTGTLPLGVERPARITLQVYDGTTPLLSTPLRIDVGALTSRAIAPGETIELRLASAWSPPRSGVFRAEATLEIPQLSRQPVSSIARAIRVGEPLPVPNLVADGTGWTSATVGSEPAIWTFLPRSRMDGNLTLATPLDLRSAASAILEVEHRAQLEEGFDAGVVEVQAPNGTWIPLAPLDDKRAPVVAPSALVPEGARSALAFTGTIPTRVDAFDLADVLALRERFVLANVIPSNKSKGNETWLGPTGRAGLWAASWPAPEGAPEDATAYERRDTIAYSFEVPANVTGALSVAFHDWRAFGLSHDPGASSNGVSAFILGPSGQRIDPAEPDAPQDRYREWSERTLAFPAALPLLAGVRATLVFEHVEVAPRVGPGAFANGAISPHGGHALADVRASLESVGDLALSAPLAATSARWVTPDGVVPATTPASAGYRPIAPDDVWATQSGVWVARADRGRFPDARLSFAVDLRAASRNVTLQVEHDRVLSTLVDAATNTTSAVSLFGIEVSEDGGRTWRPVPPTTGGLSILSHEAAALRSRHSTFGEPDAEGDSPFGIGGVALGGNVTNATAEFDLSAFSGRDVLVALHASFSTAPEAAADSLHVRSLRVEADLFRGDDVRVRLRGVADADGADGAWQIVNVSAKVVRQAGGLGVRLLAPGQGPLSEGYRVLEIEVVNRGVEPTPSTKLAILVTEPVERDMRAHGTNRTVPPLAPGESARISVRGADMNWILAANVSPTRVDLALAPIPGEALLADNQLTTYVGGPNVQNRSALSIARVRASPQASLNETITFTANVTNDGEDPVALGPSILRVWRDGVNVRNLTNARPTTARVLPGETIEIAWSWKPAPDMARGTYDAEANVATTTARGSIVRTMNATFYLGARYLDAHAVVERFDPPRESWLCVSASPCMREETARVRSGAAALAIGVPAGGIAPQGASASRVVVESFEFPINTTLPALMRVHVRHALEAGANVTILTALVADNGTRGQWTELARLTGRSTGYDEGRFSEIVAPIPPAPNGTRAAVFRFGAPSPSAAGAPFLVIDDLSVTSLNASWSISGPLAIADGVEKRIRVDVRNDGAMTDRYTIGLRDELGRNATFPPGWTARAVDVATQKIVAAVGAKVNTTIEVEAGQGRAIDILVYAPPTGAGSPLRGPIPIALTLNSTTLPDLSRTATLDIRAKGLARANASIVDVVVRDPAAPVGRSRTVEVALANDGLAAIRAPLTLTIHPPLGVEEAPEDLASTEGALSLGPGARKSASFVWTPRSPGEYRLVAQLGDIRAEKLVRIAALPYPDLRTGISFEDEALLLGVPARYALRVENLGGAAALGVEVSLTAGVTDALAEGSPLTIGDLAVGAAWTRSGAWVPGVPGDSRVVASAFARAGLSEPVETLADNADVIPIVVREPSARLEWLARAGATPTFRLVNGANANESYTLDAAVPDGWTSAIAVNGSPSRRVTLPPGGFANVSVRLLPLPNALAGEHAIRLVAESEETGQRTIAQARHSIAARPALRATLVPSPLSPREPAITILLENGGNLIERVRFEALALPPGMHLSGDVLEVAPGESKAARLFLATEGLPAPGPAAVRISWAASADAGMLSATLAVREIRDVELELEARPIAGGAGDAILRVRNVGNVPVSGLVEVEMPGGFMSDLDGRAISLRPGQSAELAGWIAAPVGANASVRLRVALDGGAKHTMRVDVASSDLALASWAAPDAWRAGEPARQTLVLRNAGDVAATGVLAELYADGALVSAADIGELPAGAEADASLAWEPAPGQHTITLVVSSLNGFADANPDDNAKAITIDVAVAPPELIPAALRVDTPGVGGALVLAFVFVLAVGRRRRA